MLCASLDGEKGYIYISMAESLLGSPETIIMLLMATPQYTMFLVLIKEKNVKKKKSGVWICVTDPLCCTAETNCTVNQLYSIKDKNQKLHTNPLLSPHIRLYFSSQLLSQADISYTYLSTPGIE